MSVLAQPDLQAMLAAMPGLYLVLDRDLRIVAASDSFLHATRTRREDVIGRHVFDVFPENRTDPDASGAANMTASFDRVLRLRRPDAMPVQRYDLRAPESVGQSPSSAAFEERYWKPLNSPVLDEAGEVRWIINAVEDVTEDVLRRRGGRSATPIAVEKRHIINQLRRANGLLGPLPESTFELLADHLTPVLIPAGLILIEPGEPVETVYFPLEGLNSAILNLKDGSSAELAMSGRSGLAGVSVLTGAATEDTETRAQISGSALVIRANVLRELIATYPELHAPLLRFVPMLMAQVGLSVVCNARHSADQRLAKWLLTASARVGSRDLPLTQESIALSLGIRRTGVSEALGHFSKAGLIATGRNRIIVKDAQRLEARSCECFRDNEAAHAHSEFYETPNDPIEPAKLHALLDRYFKLTAGSAPERHGTPAPGGSATTARDSSDPLVEA